MSLKKTSVLLLATFQLLQGTWLLQGGIDLLFPRTAVVEAPAAADGCCVGSCGCPVAEQKRKACCCFPAGAPTTEQAAPVKIRLSAFDEAACAGAAATITALVQQPAVPAFAPVLVVVFIPLDVERPEPRPAVPPIDRALDKVPV
jgi:hypothetical protein